MTLTPPITIPPPDDQLTAPSEMLLATFIDARSPVIDCEWCGRVHFDANGEDMERGELGRLMTKLDAQPDKYHTHDGGPHWGHLCGLQYVAGCPCNRAAVLEAFLWQFRFKSADYLARRARHELLAAAHMNTMVEHLPELLNPVLPLDDAVTAAERGDVKWIRCGSNGCILKRGHKGPHAAEGELKRRMWAVVPTPPDADPNGPAPEPFIGTVAAFNTPDRGNRFVCARCYTEAVEIRPGSWIHREGFDRPADAGHLVEPLAEALATVGLPCTLCGDHAPFHLDECPHAGPTRAELTLSPAPAPEPKLTPGHRCPYTRPGTEDEPEGRQCDGWIYPPGHKLAKKDHQHVFYCNKPVDGGTCSEKEGHTGPCNDIPF